MTARLLPLAIALACAQPVGASEVALETDEQRALYALGLSLGGQLALYAPSEAELALITAGLVDTVRGREPKVTSEEAAPHLQALYRVRRTKIAAERRKLGAAYIASIAGEPGVTQLASGVVMQEQKAGTGPSPTTSDRVQVHYHGTRPDGSVFDSSADRGEPATIPLDSIIPCWKEALPLMRVGGKSRIVCPPELAYGDDGAPPRVQPGETLIFDVELLAIVP